MVVITAKDSGIAGYHPMRHGRDEISAAETEPALVVVALQPQLVSRAGAQVEPGLPGVPPGKPLDRVPRGDLLLLALVESTEPQWAGAEGQLLERLTGFGQ